MAKYRKKAVEIDAYQIGHGQMPAWFLKAAEEWRIELWVDWNPVTRVMTRSGWVEARRHDYVFLNHRDELQVWKEDEFLKVFEPYEEPTKLTAAEKCVAAVRWHLCGDKLSANDIFDARKAIEDYCIGYCGAPASEATEQRSDVASVDEKDRALDSAEHIIAAVRYHLQDPIDSSDIRTIIKDIDAYCEATKKELPVAAKRSVETKNALYTEGGEFGTSISVTSEFKGMFALAQLDAYIENLTRVRDNIRKKTSPTWEPDPRD